MIVLDACVLIAHLDAEDVHHNRAAALLAATGDIPLRTSVLTMAEVLVGPIRAGRGDQARQALHDLGVAAVELPADAAPMLAGFRANNKLKMPDCCVLLTALAHDAGLATFDDQLARVADDHGVLWVGPDLAD